LFMKRTQQQDLLACLAIALLGCASSPIVDLEPAEFDDEDLASEDESAATAEDQDEAESENGEDLDQAEPEPPPEDGDQTVRAPAQGPQSGLDAGPRTGRAPLGSVDAGDRIDSGRTRTPSSTGDSGGGTTLAAGRCEKDSQCTNSCVPVGILPCCTLLKTCGCTWAPGAYCL
jgi:hypothetical protein